jgi:hypothetical protein
VEEPHIHTVSGDEVARQVRLHMHLVKDALGCGCQVTCSRGMWLLLLGRHLAPLVQDCAGISPQAVQDISSFEYGGDAYSIFNTAGLYVLVEPPSMPALTFHFSILTLSHDHTHHTYEPHAPQSTPCRPHAGQGLPQLT